MKKLIVLLAFMFMVSTAHAGIISYDTTVVGSSATLQWIKDALSGAYNEINGDLDSDNIAAGGVNSMDIATAANPLTRENELIGEMVYSGATIATSATLASTITACVAYVENDSDGTLHRVVTADTAKTFTSTPPATARDWWVYLSFGGAFYYNEQTTGATQPTTPDNYTLIAKVVTSTTAITSVVDYRQVTPTNLRIYQNYRAGCLVSYDSATIIKIAPGEIELGTTGKVRKNSITTFLTMPTDLRAGDTNDAGRFYYVHVYPDTATTTKFLGKISASSSDAGVSDERCVGWFYNIAASTISADNLCTNYKGNGDPVPNVYMARKNPDNVAIAIDTTIKLHTAKFYSSGRPLRISSNVRVGYASGAGYFPIRSSISIDAAVDTTTEITALMGEAGGPSGSIIKKVNAGEHTIDLAITTGHDYAGIITAYNFSIEEL